MRRRNRFKVSRRFRSLISPDDGVAGSMGTHGGLEQLEDRLLMSASLPQADPLEYVSSEVTAAWFTQLSPSSADPNDPAYRASAILSDAPILGTIEYQGESVDAVTNQWLLQLTKSGVSQAALVEGVNDLLDLHDLGGTVVGGMGLEGMVLIQADASINSTSFVSALKANDLVAFVEPNLVIQTTATPNDSSFGSLWGLHNTGQTGGTNDADIDAKEAWNISTGSANTVVAVIDTGVDFNHNDLRNNMWINPGEIAGNGRDDDGNGFIDDVYGWDFANNDKNPMDDNGHGTHVAGTIGAVGNNNNGVVGVNWDVSIMALKFLGANGSGFTSHALQAVNYATMMKNQHGINVRVTNNSWGGGGYYAPLDTAIRASRNADILFIAAAGNEGRNNETSPSYPASYNSANIISVAATDSRDRLAGFSNYGANTVDIAAPGVSIRSTLPGNSYGNYSGTSMATPHVAGVAALLFSHNPQLGYMDVKNAILNGADQITALNGKVLTGGRLNAFNAIRGVQGNVQPDFYEQNDSVAQVNALTPGASGSANLGQLWAGTTLSGLNTVDDGIDWFRFNMNDSGNASNYVRITYDNSQGTLNLRVYDVSDWSLVGSSSGNGTTDTVSLNHQSAGDFFVEVWSVNDAVISNYSLQIIPSVDLADAYEENDTSAVVDAADEAAVGSPNLGYVLSRRAIGGLNTLDDAEDWFKFSIAGKGSKNDYVKINFRHALGDLDLAAYDANGNIVGQSTSVSNSETIKMTGWAGGEYYVRVYGYQGASSPAYNLVFRTPTGPKDNAGNNLRRAKNVKNLNRRATFRDLVGMGDAADYYKVRLKSAGQLTLQLRRLTNNADVELVDRFGQTIASSANLGVLNESLSETVSRGKYYIRVSPHTSARTNYKLRILLAKPPAIPAPNPAGVSMAQLATVFDTPHAGPAMTSSDVADEVKNTALLSIAGDAMLRDNAAKIRGFNPSNAAARVLN